MIKNLLLTFIAMLWHGEATHIQGAAPASKASDTGAERGFLVCVFLSELPGVRKALGVPWSVSTTRAFFIARNTQNQGGHTMQKSDKIQKPKQKNEISQIISETNQLINKIKYDYHIAEMLASSALHAIKGMSSEVDVVTHQLSMLTSAREDAPIKILPFKGGINATGHHEKQT